MALFTPEKKLQECDSRFAELSDQFAKKIKNLVEEWTYIYKVGKLIDDGQALLEEYSVGLKNRKKMTPTANELMGEINRVESLCNRTQGLITTLDETVDNYRLRVKARKRKERLNTIAMSVAGVVLIALFIAGYVTFRLMAG